MYKLYAVFTGLLIAIMVTFNGILSSYTDVYFSTFIIHIIGFFMVSIILIIKKQKLKFNQHIPLFLFTAGFVGVALTISNNLCFSKLGVSLTLSLGLLGQSIASCVIDNFGLLGMSVHKFNKNKLFGFILIFTGISIMIIF